jgi:hypothetical protein
MRILASHKFADLERKEIRVLQLSPRECSELQLPDGDQLALETIAGGKTHRTYLRPDECLILIRLLSKGVYLAVEGFYLTKHAKPRRSGATRVNRKGKDETTGRHK